MDTSAFEQCRRAVSGDDTLCTAGRETEGVDGRGRHCLTVQPDGGLVAKKEAATQPEERARLLTVPRERGRSGPSSPPSGSSYL